ncbi:hypothetical protein PIB30_021445 [Stylosanthes scabra]|uniref:Uncharacterized protein n=1 Tax=Stylosanthes scabra TaxID=79078 RepID=A0ABU6V8Q1_9FABA|nr:hypothetical protein [Stylosanthes scabra]
MVSDSTLFGGTFFAGGSPKEVHVITTCDKEPRGFEVAATCVGAERMERGPILPTSAIIAIRRQPEETRGIYARLTQGDPGYGLENPSPPDSNKPRNKASPRRQAKMDVY